LIPVRVETFVEVSTIVLEESIPLGLITSLDESLNEDSSNGLEESIPFGLITSLDDTSFEVSSGVVFSEESSTNGMFFMSVDL
jgi:hypothetical protein